MNDEGTEQGRKIYSNKNQSKKILFCFYVPLAFDDGCATISGNKQGCAEDADFYSLKSEYKLKTEGRIRDREWNRHLWRVASIARPLPVDRRVCRHRRTRGIP